MDAWIAGVLTADLRSCFLVFVLVVTGASQNTGGSLIVEGCPLCFLSFPSPPLSPSFLPLPFLLPLSPISPPSPFLLLYYTSLLSFSPLCSSSFRENIPFLLATASNTWGLLILSLLLGYGLVEVPRTLWNASRRNYSLNHCYFKAAKLYMDLSDADEKLKEVVEVRGYVGGRENGGTWVHRGKGEWRYVGT